MCCANSTLGRGWHSVNSSARFRVGPQRTGACGAGGCEWGGAGVPEVACDGSNRRIPRFLQRPSRTEQFSREVAVSAGVRVRWHGRASAADRRYRGCTVECAWSGGHDRSNLGRTSATATETAIARVTCECSVRHHSFRHTSRCRPRSGGMNRTTRAGDSRDSCSFPPELTSFRGRLQFRREIHHSTPANGPGWCRTAARTAMQPRGRSRGPRCSRGSGPANRSPVREHHGARP